MGKPSVAKPVAIPDTAVELCELFVNTKIKRNEMEKLLETLKNAAMSLVPRGQDKEEFPAKRGERNGKYRVTIIAQDRRKIDDDKLIEMLVAKQLYKPSLMKATVDHERVAQLVKDGTISKADIESCMVGTQPLYPLVEFVEG